MARRSFKSSTWTPVAVADTANFTANGYMAIQGGSATQRIDIWEVFMGGQAASAAPSIMLVSRDSTVGATLTALTTGQSDAALDPATAALAAPPARLVADPRYYVQAKPETRVIKGRAGIREIVG